MCSPCVLRHLGEVAWRCWPDISHLARAQVEIRAGFPNRRKIYPGIVPRLSAIAPSAAPRSRYSAYGRLGSNCLMGIWVSGALENAGNGSRPAPSHV